MTDRRVSKRAGVNILINKYVDGFPHICRAIDISEDGVLVRRIHEPETERDFFALEIGIPGAPEPLWIWSRQAWKDNDRQGLRFVGLGPQERELLGQLLKNQQRAA